MTEKEFIHESAKLCVEFNSVAKEVSSCKIRIETPIMSKTEFKKNCKPLSKLFIIVYTIIVVLLFNLAQICPTLYKSYKIRHETTQLSYLGPVDYGDNMFFSLLPFIVLIICFIVLFVIKNTKINRLYLIYTDDYNMNTKKEINHLKEITPKYSALYEKVYDKTQCIIPDSYIHAAEAIDKLITNNRADTLKEAINVYEQDIHNQILRHELQKQTQSIDYQTDSLRDEIKWQDRKSEERHKEIKKHLGI